MCQVEIDRVEGANYDPALGQYTAINVIGSVRGCRPSYTDGSGQQWARIAVSITAGAHSREDVATVLTNGDLASTFPWTAFFKDIPCGGHAEVEARCMGGPDDCVAHFEGLMECDEPPCPPVSFDSVEGAGCKNGERRVEITATVQGPPLNQFVVWRYGAGNIAVSSFSNSTQTTVVLAYDAQDLAHGEVVFELDPDCRHSLTVSPDLRRPCDTACPDVDFTLIEDAGCDDEDNRRVRITAEYTGPVITGYVVWHYGAGRQATSHVGGEQETTVILVYGPDDLLEPDVSLQLSPECSESLTLPPRVLTPCVPPPRPQEDQNGEEPQVEETHTGGSCFCTTWLVLNVILMLGTGVAIIVAGCLFVEPLSIAIAVGLALVTAASWFFFWLICLQGTGDCVLARWASFLLDLLATIAFIVALITGVVSVIVEVTVGCLIGALIAFAYYGLIALWFKNLVIMMGCYDGSSYLPWEG